MNVAYTRWQMYNYWVTERFFADFWLHRPTRTTNKPRTMYPCGKCQKVYSNASSLYRHLKLECGILPQFHCPYCRFSSKRKFNLGSHVAHKHGKLVNCYMNK
ncbi:Longitudinals lacking protein, isoforms A/B/D/L [Anthophora quadrimaculata]